MDNTNGKKLRERAEEILQSKSEDLQIKKDSEIKELMRTQSELEESRNKYQELYNFAPVGYFSFNRSGVIREVNLTGCNQLGVDRNYLINKPLLSFIATGYQELFFRHLKTVFEQKKPAKCEIKLKRRDRSEFFARIESSISEDTPGPEAVLCKTTVNDITEEVRYREKVESSLKEKEISLTEIHHRVKNNLAMISSLLSLQKSYLHDKETIAIFEQSRQRIQSIGLIHEKLYRSGDLTHIDFADYAGELISSLMDSFTEESDHIALDIDVEPSQFTIDTMIPLALIITELITNALKYGFPNNGGRMNGKSRIYVYLHREDEKWKLIIGNNGKPFPKHIDIEKTDSLGLNLVTLLVQQLEGTIELNREEGAEFNITFSTAS
jgi:PAS domain S-box-containing protein